jgi:hypothetical protein
MFEANITYKLAPFVVQSVVLHSRNAAVLRHNSITVPHAIYRKCFHRSIQMLLLRNFPLSLTLHEENMESRCEEYVRRNTVSSSFCEELSKI